jgi:hypothetical protein
MLTERIGAFLDSTMDRHSDMLLDMGLLLLYALGKGWTRMPEKAGP